ncbi:MAG: histidine phosphatase family protein [Mariprofundaceae bacterium]|nr:histidine phosphatase family protein [Mariprofundaceae bacterium]
MLTIDLLRHGALQGGVKYRGSMEEALTEQGRDSMNQVWAHIQQDVTSIISSPLSRCAEPAQSWAKERQIPCVIEPLLQELHYGEWEGLTAAEIEQHTPNQLAKWRQDPTLLSPPQGESMLLFAARVKQAWTQLLAQHQDGHILIVAHSGSMRLLLSLVLQAPIVSTRHLQMPYACWSRVQVKAQQASLCFHGKRV